MTYFYDTNVLLCNSLQSLDKYFYLSSITIEELENIKTSSHQDDDIKYKARKAIRWLSQHEDQYEVIQYDISKLNFNFFTNIDNNDKKIILTILYCIHNLHKQDIVFKTYDLGCYLLAKETGIAVSYFNQDDEKIYQGYSNIYCNSDIELSDFYGRLFSGEFGEEDFYINEYLLIHQNNKIIDKYKYIGDNKFIQVPFISCNSKMFGKVKPIDPYQELVMDSFKNNQLTLVKGIAGTGKSLLSMSYLFQLLQQGAIDKIIIFCNTVATAGSARLGFYPGSRTEKLLDSQIGNFLISKIGAREGVERLIEQGQLLLLPMSDLRGFDTSGMKAGIYITQAQNLQISLMKLALQRIGQDSICILDGDNESQVDLPIYSGSNNGLKRVSQIFKGQPFYGEVTLKTVHRSKIAKIASQM